MLPLCHQFEQAFGCGSLHHFCGHTQHAANQVDRPTKWRTHRIPAGSTSMGTSFATVHVLVLSSALSPLEPVAQRLRLTATRPYAALPQCSHINRGLENIYSLSFPGGEVCLSASRRTGQHELCLNVGLGKSSSSGG